MTSDTIAKLDSALASCMKCGFCKAACPVFIGEETTSPRAKVRLARAVATGQLELTEGVSAQMSRCLNCRACANDCPGGVEPNKIALTMRGAVVERDGLPLGKRAVFHIGLKHPKLMAWGSRAVGIAQQVSGIDMQNNPLRDILPFLGFRRDKDLPVMGRRTLMARLPERLEAFGEKKTTVTYFPGCATNFIYPEIGLATVNILRRLGAEVILPHNLLCCSTPVFNSGDVDGARVLAEHNITALRSTGAEFVVTSCGSCGLTIKAEWGEVLGLAEASQISEKTLDITQFIAKFASEDTFKPLDVEETYTYHDSCHLRRGMGVHKEPRELLRAVLGGRFVEMEMSDRCCGGGGTFSLYHPELSQTVAETKMRCLSESGAQVVATGCPACIMQLRDSIVHRKMPQRVVHTVELINRALRSDG